MRSLFSDNARRTMSKVLAYALLFNNFGWIQTASAPERPIEKRAPKNVRAGRATKETHAGRAPRETSSPSPVASGKSGVLDQVFECVCQIKACVDFLKEQKQLSLDDPCWQSLIDSIEDCGRETGLEPPETHGQALALQACGQSEILERLGCFDCPSDLCANFTDPDTVLGCLCLLKELVGRPELCCDKTTTKKITNAIDKIMRPLPPPPEDDCPDDCLDECPVTIFGLLEFILEHVCGLFCELEQLQFTICDKIDNLECTSGTVTGTVTNPCDATPIFNNPWGEPITISECGHYCLAENVGMHGGDPTIEICASNVVLDLNGHKVFVESYGKGIVVKDGLCNVIIKNGFVLSKDPDPKKKGDIGIYLKGPSKDMPRRAMPMRPTPPPPPLPKEKSKGITICDVSLKQLGDGISTCEVDKLLIKNVTACDCCDYGAFIFNSCTVEILHSNFSQNESTKVGAVQTGLCLFCSKGVRIDNCILNKNGNAGVMLDECECVEVLHTQASGKADGSSSGPGFFVCDMDLTNTKCSENLVFRDCFACCYHDGFKFQDAECVCALDCIAKDNVYDGFHVVADYTSSSSCEPCILVDSCIAECNGRWGFFDDGNSIDNSQYYRNTACKNGTNGTQNYSSSIVSHKTAKVTSPQNAYARDNVDCENTDPDRIEEVKFTVCDKIDNLRQSLGFTICDKIDNLRQSLAFTIVDRVDNARQSLGFTVCDKVDNARQSLGFTIVDSVDNARQSLGFTVCDKVDNARQSLGFTIVDSVDNARQSLGFTVCDKVDNARQSLGFTIVDSVDNARQSLGFTVCDKVENARQSLGFTIVDSVDNARQSLGFTVCDKVDNARQSLAFTIVDSVDNARQSLGFTVCDKVDNAQQSLGFTIVDSVENAVQSLGFTVCDKVENSQASLGFTVCDKVESAIDVITACFATPVFGPTTIDVSGHYCLANNIAGDILVTATNVTLDLNGYTVNAENNGICITGDGVLVHNGAVKGAAEVGIKVQGNKNRFEHLDLVGNTTGIELRNANDNTIDNVRAMCNSQAGFFLNAAMRNCVLNSKAIGNGGEGNSFGFVARDGMCNLFDNCLADDNDTTGEPPTFAAGFLLTGCESKSKIVHCQSDNHSGDSAFGIRLEVETLTTEEMMLDGIISATYSNDMRDVCSIDWLLCDGTKYLAVGSENNTDPNGAEVRVLRFNQAAQVFEELLSATADLGQKVADVQWQVCGSSKFLSVVSAASGDNVRIYNFDPLAGSLALVDAQQLTDCGLNPVQGADADWLTANGGKYLAVGGDSGAVTIFQVAANGLLTTVTCELIDNRDISAVGWHICNDTKYLAIATNNNAGSDPEVHVLEFDPVASSLTQVVSATFNHTTDVKSLDWLQDSSLLAIGGANGLGGANVRVLAFDCNNQTLNELSTFAYGGNCVSAIKWHQCNHTTYLAVGGSSNQDEEVHVLLFDNNQLIETAATFEHAADVFSVDWLTCGQGCDKKTFLAIGGEECFDVNIRVVEFNGCVPIPECNIVKRNHVANNDGVGIQDDFLQWSNNEIYANFSCKNDTNFNIGPQFPISSSKAKAVGETENIDCALDAPGIDEEIKFTICDKLENAQASLGFTICDKIDNACQSLKFTICDKVDNARQSLGFTICDKVDNASQSLGFTICDKVNNARQSIGFTICDKVDNARQSLGFTICDEVNTALVSLLDELDIIESKVDKVALDVICTKTTVGSVCDLSHTTTGFSTIDGIDNTKLSVIGWLKTIVREIRGLDHMAP